MRFSTRIDAELLDFIVRAKVDDLSIAEISRLTGREAARLGVMRPSYDAVRRVVRAERDRRAALREALVEALNELYAYPGPDVIKVARSLAATRRSVVHGKHSA